MDRPVFDKAMLSLALACAVPVFMATLMSYWFLLLLLMPATAVLMVWSIQRRHRLKQCLRCGADISQTPDKCGSCGLDRPSNPFHS